MNTKTAIILTCIFLFTLAPVEAHPGRTASDGCRYCRTNCDSWGVAWNERHCHGGSEPEPIHETAPYVPLPTRKPYIPPTKIPTPKPTVRLSPKPSLKASVKPARKKIAKHRKTPTKSF